MPSRNVVTATTEIESRQILMTVRIWYVWATPTETTLSRENDRQAT